MHRHSALEALYKIGKCSTNEKQSLTFKELKSLEIMQIACWPNKIEEINNLLIKKLKIKHIPGFNEGIVFENKSLWRMEPLKWWLFNKEIEISEQIATILDMSHAFTGTEGGNTAFDGRDLVGLCQAASSAGSIIGLCPEQLDARVHH